MRRIWLAAAAALLLLIVFLLYPSIFPAKQLRAGPVAAPIVATEISAFDPAAPEERDFGPLRFAGGLVLRSSNPHFAALSGLRVSGDRLLAVSDTGFWFSGRLLRNADGSPSGVEDGMVAPLLGDGGAPFAQKWLGDAEAVAMDAERIFVSTEQMSRILIYPRSDPLSSRSAILPGRIPGRGLRSNRGMEALAVLPEGHPFAGGLLAVVEGPTRGAPDMRAFIWKDGAVDELTVKRSGQFMVTDADLAPDGDLLLLERRFSPAIGASMQIRRIPIADVAPGATIDGPIIAAFDRRFQIDNMEGLSVFAAPDGSTRIGLISDDNKWPLQRTLYLEFILRD